MTFLAKRIDWYRRNSFDYLSWPTTPTGTINGTFNVSVSVGLANKKDTFGFRIDNSYGSLAGAFLTGDNIKIFVGQNVSNASLSSPNDLIIDGIVMEVRQEISDGGKVYTITGKSRSEYLLEALVLLDARGKTPPEIAQEVINFVNNLQGTESKTRLITDSTSIPTLRSEENTNRTHDTFQYATVYKQAYQVLEDISSVNYTKDKRGKYIFYIDNQNKFYFTYKSGTIDSNKVIEGNSTLTPTQLKIGIASNEIINFIIAACGADPNGKGILAFIPDYPSIQRHGIRARFVSTTSYIAQDIMQTEELNKKSSFDSTNGFVPNAFPYTTYWQSSKTENNPSDNPPATTINQTVTCSSKAQYVDAVRREARWRAEEKVKGILKSNSNPRLRVEAEFVRTTSFQTADLIAVTIESHGVNERNMRLVELSYDDYQTMIALEDDEPIVGTV